VDTRNRSIELDEGESMSPVIPAPGMRKRRRVQATPTDEEEQEVGDRSSLARRSHPFLQMASYD